MNEIEQVLDRLHVGIHSGDGINRLHWISFVDFIINNPVGTRKKLIHKLISVMGIRERTVLEYVNSAIAWGVLEISGGDMMYNKTYESKRKRKKKNQQLNVPKEKTDDEILKNRIKEV